MSKPQTLIFHALAFSTFSVALETCKTDQQQCSAPWPVISVRLGGGPFAENVAHRRRSVLLYASKHVSKETDIVRFIPILTTQCRSIIMSVFTFRFSTIFGLRLLSSKSRRKKKMQFITTTLRWTRSRRNAPEVFIKFILSNVKENSFPLSATTAKI